MKDISHYKRTPIEPQPTPASRSAAEPQGYVAFQAKDKPARLRIRPANAATYAAQYLHLNAVAYDGDYGSNFVLMFGFITIRVRGQNLQQMITAIEMGTADFIQEFDADRWAKPTDPTAPIIEWLEIEASPMAAPTFGAESSKAKTRPH